MIYSLTRQDVKSAENQAGLPGDFFAP